MALIFNLRLKPPTPPLTSSQRNLPTHLNTMDSSQAGSLTFFTCPLPKKPPPNYINLCMCSAMATYWAQLGNYSHIPSKTTRSRKIMAGWVRTILGKSFFFLSGVYVAQNYNVPNIRSWVLDNVPGSERVLNKIHGAHESPADYRNPSPTFHNDDLSVEK